MTKTDQVLNVAKSQGVVRARDLKEKGLPPRYLSRLAERGQLEREGKGLYRHPEAPLTEHHSLALTAAQYPDATVCLLSALQNTIGHAPVHRVHCALKPTIQAEVIVSVFL